MAISSNPPPASPFRYSPQIPPESTYQEELSQKLYIEHIWYGYKEAARTRGEQATKLKDQQTGHLISEKQRRGSFIVEERDTLRLIQGKELSKEYLSLEEKALEQAKLFFRKKAVAYLLANREEMERLYQSAVKSTVHNIVASKDIFRIVGKRLSDEIFPSLPAESFQAFEDAINQEPGATVFELSRAYPDYPVLSSAEVDLDCLQDLEWIYGDILAFISGVGYSRWRSIQKKIEENQAESLQYQNRYPALPNPQRLGFLKEPLRIFLSQESTRLKLEETITGVAVVGAANLSSYIKQFGEKPFFLEEFKQWLQSEYKNLPLLSLYKVIYLIQAIAQSQPDFAEVILIALENILSQYHPSSSNPTYLGQQLTDLATVIDLEMKQPSRKSS